MDKALEYGGVEVREVEGQQDDGEDAHQEGEQGPAQVGDEVVATADTEHVVEPLSLGVEAALRAEHHQAIHLLHVDRPEELQHEGPVHHNEDSGNQEKDEWVVENERGEISLEGAIFLNKIRLELRVLF